MQFYFTRGTFFSKFTFYIAAAPAAREHANGHVSKSLATAVQETRKTRLTLSVFRLQRATTLRLWRAEVKLVTCAQLTEAGS